MKLLLKQRFFSWFDCYDIYDAYGNTIFTVQGKPSWGHKLEIYDHRGVHVGTIREEVFAFLPRFRLYAGDTYLGQVRKKFTFLRPAFDLDCNDWQVQGDWLEWNYHVADSNGVTIMTAEKQVLRMTDTYVIDIVQPQDTLLSLMIVLAIDAVKCAQE